MRQSLVVAAFILSTALSPGSSAAEQQGAPASAPASVVATPGNASVTLAWTPVSGAAGYRVYRGANGRWDPVPVASTRRTTHTSANLDNGTTYSFTVAAYTKAGDGPVSLAVTTTPIAPPADVVITPGNGRVTLKWTPSVGATSYIIYRRVASEAKFSELASGVLSPPFVDGRLTNGKRYFYQVSAVAGATQSDLSDEVSDVPQPSSRWDLMAASSYSVSPRRP